MTSREHRKWTYMVYVALLAALLVVNHRLGLIECQIFGERWVSIDFFHGFSGCDE